MSYGIMFWGNSSHSFVIFKTKKRVLRIIMECGYRESYRELFQEPKIHSHHSIYSLYYCSLLIIGITLFQMLYIITLIPDEKKIYTCLSYLWLCIRGEFVIQASKFLTVFPRQLRTSPASLKCLKLL